MNHIFRSFLLVLACLAAYTNPAIAQTLIQDINSGTNSTFDEDEYPQFVYAKSLTFFVADDGIHGKELWVTNGTASGTKMVKDINAVYCEDLATYGSYPFELVVFNGVVYFLANDGIHDVALWKSDGTAAGTKLVDELSDISKKDYRIASRISKKTGHHKSKKDFSHKKGFGKRGSNARSSKTAASASRAWTEMVVVGSTLYLCYSESGTAILAKTVGTNDKVEVVIDTVQDIGNLTGMNDILYFAAKESDDTELWRSDGTYSGTFQLKNINASASSSPDYLTVLDKTLYFTANDGECGVELWKSDGSEANTQLVKDIYATGIDSSTPQNLTVVGKTLFFTADDGTNGRELWRTNGDASNTVMVKNVHPTTGANIGSLATMGGYLYFTANDGTNGTKVYKTDGTQEGTILLKKDTSNNYDLAEGLTPVGTVLYFSAKSATYGQELWKTDGTSANTVWTGLDINPDGNGNPKYLTNSNNALYFTAYEPVKGRELWKYPGTAAITDIVTTSGNAFADDVSEWWFDMASSLFYFVATDEGTNYHLYSTTGAAGNATKIFTFDSASDCYALVGTSTTLFVIRKKDTGKAYDYILYKLNTATKPKQLDKVQEGGNDIYIALDGDGNPIIDVVGSYLYFQYTDSTAGKSNDRGLTAQKSNGNEVWVTNGTTTRSVIIDGTSTTIIGMPTSDVVNNLLYFTNTAETHLYKIKDATNYYKAVEIKDTNATPQPVTGAYAFTSFKNTLYFLKDDNLWRIETAAPNTGKAKEFYNDTNDIVDIMGATNRLFFTIDETSEKYKLYQTDGTAAPTAVKDANANEFYLVDESYYESTGSIIYFLAGTSNNNTLWQTDGTAVNTKPVKDSNGRVFSGIGSLVTIPGKAHFSYNDGVYGWELWESAGTTATTKMSKDINVYGSTSFHAFITATSGSTTKLYFVAGDGHSTRNVYGHGNELWVK